LGFHEMTIFFAQDLRNFRAYFHIANLAHLLKLRMKQKKFFLRHFSLQKLRKTESIAQNVIFYAKKGIKYY